MVQLGRSTHLTIEQQSMPSWCVLMRKHSGYMLLEFDPGSRSRYMLDFVRSILDMTAASDAKAKHVVLAHVERYSNLANDDEALNTLLAWGCRIQINAYSLAEEQKAFHDSLCAQVA